MIGEQGQRGTKQAAVATAGTVWSDSEANAALAAAGWGTPINGDVVTLYSSAAGFSQTRVWATGAWSALAAFFGGNVLVDGTVEGKHLKTGTVTTNKLTIGGANLIANADFATGDFTNWRKWDSALSNQSVIPASTGGVPSGAPTANVCQFVASATSVSTFAAVAEYSDAGAGLDGFAVSPGEVFNVSIAAARSASLTATIFQVRAYFWTSAGTYSVTPVTALAGLQAGLTNAWQTFTGQFTAPAGSVRCWLFVHAQGLTAGSIYWTNLSAQKRLTATGLVDGAVGPTQLDQAALSVAGLAVFGDVLQSTDFIAGVSGWQITKGGAAEFNQLIVRNWLQDGAVSDKITYTTAGPVTFSANTVLATFAVGEVLPHQIWKRSITYEAKRNSGDSFQIMLQRRKKYAGVWSAWSTTDSSTVNELTHDAFADSGTFSGVLEDSEYRLLSSAGAYSGEIKNIRFTAVNVVK